MESKIKDILDSLSYKYLHQERAGTLILIYIRHIDSLLLIHCTYYCVVVNQSFCPAITYEAVEHTVYDRSFAFIILHDKYFIVQQSSAGGV